MAEIKVAIKGDDSDLKAKFRESSEEARRFEEAVKKSMETVGAVSKNAISETGLGGIAKLLGAAGLTGAAIEFSHRIIEGFKNAVSAALDFGKQVGQLRSALGGTFGGQAEYWADQIRNISGAMGSFEDNMAVFKGLLRGGMLPQDALKNLIDIQNAAKALGVSVSELGDKFAEMKERGELPERFFRQFPALAPIVRGMGGGENPSVDWMFKTLLPAIAPGGLQAPGRVGAEAGIGGQIARQQEEFQKNWIELGRDLLPLVNASLKELKGYMPEITANFKALSEELQKAVPNIVGFMHQFMTTGERFEHPTTPFGKGFKAVNDYLDGLQDRITNLFNPASKYMQDAAREHKEAADAWVRATHPH